MLSTKIIFYIIFVNKIKLLQYCLGFNTDLQGNNIKLYCCNNHCDCIESGKILLSCQFAVCFTDTDRVWRNIFW